MKKFALILMICFATVLIASWIAYFTCPAYVEWYNKRSMDSMAYELGYTDCGNYYQKEVMIDGKTWRMDWTKDAWYAVNNGGLINVWVNETSGSGPFIWVSVQDQDQGS